MTTIRVGDTLLEVKEVHYIALPTPEGDKPILFSQPWSVEWEIPLKHIKPELMELMAGVSFARKWRADERRRKRKLRPIGPGRRGKGWR